MKHPSASRYVILCLYYYSSLPIYFDTPHSPPTHLFSLHPSPNPFPLPSFLPSSSPKTRGKREGIQGTKAMPYGIAFVSGIKINLPATVLPIGKTVAGK
jgi:hypothetical protein